MSVFHLPACWSEPWVSSDSKRGSRRAQVAASAETGPVKAMEQIPFLLQDTLPRQIFERKHCKRLLYIDEMGPVMREKFRKLTCLCHVLNINFLLNVNLRTERNCTHLRNPSSLHPDTLNFHTFSWLMYLSLSSQKTIYHPHFEHFKERFSQESFHKSSRYSAYPPVSSPQSLSSNQSARQL